MSYLRRRIEFLVDLIENNKLILGEEFLYSDNGKQLLNDLSSIKKLSDGSIDISSCSPLVRSVARSTYNLNRISISDEADRNFESIKKPTHPDEISKLMKIYFQLLEEFFIEATGTTSEMFSKDESFGDHVRREAEIIATRFYSAYPKYIPKIGQFHGKHSSVLLGSGEYIGGIKCVLGGSSRFPEPAFDGLRKFALYADTIFLPDPVLPWIESEREEEEFRHVHILEQTHNLLRLKPLIDANLPYPAVVVFPSWEKSMEVYDEETQDGIFELLLRFFSFYLNATFEDEREIFAYVAGDGKEEFVRAVNENRLFWPPEANGPESFNQALDSYKEQLKTWKSASWLRQLGKLTPELLVLNGIIERLAPLFHVNDNAQALEANPLFWLPPHFYYFQMFSQIENSNLQKLGYLKKDTLVSLQSLLSPSLAWLGNIPIYDLARFREENINQDFRIELAKYVDELSDVDLDDVDKVVANISLGISSLISKHEIEARKIAEEYEKKNIATLGMGILTLGATLFPGLAPYLGASLSLAPVAKYTVDSIHRKMDRKNLARSLTGILSHAQQLDNR